MDSLVVASSRKLNLRRGLLWVAKRTQVFLASTRKSFKAGVHMKAIFWLGILVQTQISRSRFKQSRISMLIPEIYVLSLFVNFWVIFRYIWR